MLIKYTEKEAKHLEEMRLEYSARLIDAKDEKEKRVLLLQFQNARDKYTEACELKRFKKLGKNLDAILEDAKAQVLALIEAEYNSLVSYSTSEELKQLGIGTEKDGKFYLSANFISSLILGEIKLHMKALKADAERLQILLAYIVETVENSDYTDDAGIILPDLENIQTNDSNVNLAPQALETLSRMPLSCVDEVGIMADKTSRIIVSEPNGMLDALMQQEANGQLYFKVNQAKKGSKEAFVMFSLTMPQEYTHLSRKITGFDIGVLNAVSNLLENWIYQYGEKPFMYTASEIWRRMNGKQPNDKAKPSPAKERKIWESIEKMRHTDIYMDITAEKEAGLIKHQDDSRIVQGRFTTTLLKCDIIEKFTNGHKVEMKGFIMQPQDMPILYAYNKAKDYIRYIPYELLDTSSVLSDTDHVTEFKYFLLSQILFLKYQAEKNITDKKHLKKINPNNIILLETIYKGAGVPTPEERNEKKLPDARAKDRKKIEGILTVFLKRNWINGFTPLNANNEPAKSTQAVKGYSIDL